MEYRQIAEIAGSCLAMIAQVKLFLPQADRSFSRVAQESFPNTDKLATRYGYLSSFMYDPDQPHHGYVGGATKWAKFLEEDGATYGFLSSNRQGVKDNAKSMVENILADSESDAPIHFNAIASGTEFAQQDIHVLRELKRQAGSSLVSCNIDEVNPDFGTMPQKIFGSEFSNLFFSSTDRDIFNDPLTQSVRITAPRRTIAFYSGGTIGNMGLTLAELEKGFPTKKMAEHIKLQFDYGADETYLIISHNAQNSDDVLENYRGKAHAAFALTSMYRIKLELQTRNFDPDSFEYRNYYLPEMDLVCHGSFSTRRQAFEIGNKDVHVDDGQEAARVGHSFQITNARMGDIQYQAGAIRLGFFPSDDGKTIFQVVKASKKLIDSQRVRFGIPA